MLAFNWDTSADTPQAVLGASNVSPAKYFVYNVRGHYVCVGINGPERRGAQARAFVPCARARVCIYAHSFPLSPFLFLCLCIYLRYAPLLTSTAFALDLGLGMLRFGR